MEYWHIIRNSVETDVTSFVSLGTTINEFQDQSLSSGELVLFPLSNENPLEPEKTLFKHGFDEGTSTDYRIYRVVSDSVDLAERGAEKAYKHTIQFVSLERDLRFHLAKGMDFSQPVNMGRMKAIGNSSYAQKDDGGQSPVYFYERLSNYNPSVSLNGKKKIWSGTISLSLYKITFDEGTGDSYFNYDTQIGDNITSFSISFFNSVGEPTGNIVISNCGNGFSRKLTESELSIARSSSSVSISTPSGNPFYYNPETFRGYNLIINAKITFETYYYTIYDVINETILGCNRPSTSVFSENRICSMPSSGNFYGIISNMISPNFQFTQGESLWDCLCDIYNKFDGMPTLDENGVLGIRYMNARKDELKDNKVGMQSSVSDENRANGLVCRYQNGSMSKTVSFPSPSYEKYAKAQCNVLGVPKNNSYVIHCPTRIQSVSVAFASLEKFTYISYSEARWTVTMNIPLDISDFIYEKSRYSELDASASYTMRPTQYNSFWYSEGSNDLYVGSINQTVEGTDYAYSNLLRSAINMMFGNDSSPTNSCLSATLEGGNDPKNIKVRFDYIPMIDGNIRVESFSEKKIGETLVSQSSGMVDLQKIGLNMFGVSMKTGEPNKTKTMALSSFSDRPKAGEYEFDENGDEWVVQGTKCSFADSGWKCDVALSKNFNQLSQRIAIDRRVTFNGISQSLVLSSETIYQEYAYFSKDEHGGSGSEMSLINHNFFASCFLSAMNSEDDYSGYSSSYAVFRGYSLGTATKSVFMSIVPYGSGNSICFEGGFDHPINAGNELVTVTGWIGSLNSKATPYTDSLGFCDKADIAICESSYGSFDSLPVMTMPASYSDRMIYISHAMIQKRPNDVFRFNYEVIALPYPNEGKDSVFPYHSLLEESFVASRSSPNRIRLFLRYENFSVTANGGGPYSPFDSKAYGFEITPSSSFKVVKTDLNPSSDAIEFMCALHDGSSPFSLPAHDLLSGNISGWMIADSDGNPLLSSNEVLVVGSHLVFYVFGSHDRI